MPENSRSRARPAFAFARGLHDLRGGWKAWSA